MLSKALWKLRTFSRRLWVRAALISLLAVVAAAVSQFLGPLVPPTLAARIGEDALRRLVDILASSMLTVTTFSLTVMVTAHFFAAQTSTPRAHRLLQQDTRTQTVLATFLGAFVYALASIVIVSSGLHDAGDYTVLYGFTILVYGLVVLAILRWIGHLSGLGSLEETTRRVEKTAQEALAFRAATPFLGGRPLRDAAAEIPGTAHLVAAPRTGFVQHVDAARLSSVLDGRGGEFFLTAPPGTWLAEGEPLGYAAVADFDDRTERALAAGITLGDVRTFMQDAEFGLLVLSETAQRALSPGVNDPQTATDVIARLTRLVAGFEPEREIEPPIAPRVRVPPLDAEAMIRVAFDPIARDGRGHVEVLLRLQRACAVLAGSRNAAVSRAARDLSARTLAHAEAGQLLEEDLGRLRGASRAVSGSR